MAAVCLEIEMPRSPPDDYRRCDQCGTWRPEKQTFAIETTVVAEGVTTKDTQHRCTDRKWCDHQREKGSTE